jgi:hypothetical protein
VARLGCAVRKPKRISAISAVGATVLFSVTLGASPGFRDKLNVALEFQVVDADTGSAISGALVAVVYPYDDEPIQPSYAKTQADGVARMSHSFDIGEDRCLVKGPTPLSERVAFYRRLGWGLPLYLLFPPTCSVAIPTGMHYEDTCHVCYGDRWLEVSAMGYRKLTIPLTTFTGEIGNFDAPNPPRVTVGLRRGDSPADSLAEWAGEYREMNSVRHATLRILADGRFARTTNYSYDRPVYGYAAIRGDEFRFLAEKRSGYDNSFIFGSKRLAPVTWGGRRYIIDAEGLRDFCKIVRQGKACDCHFGGIGSVYLRIGDEKLKPQGVPELPRKWASYLLPKPISGTVETVYRDGTAKIRMDTSEGVLEGMSFTAEGIPPHRS